MDEDVFVPVPAFDAEGNPCPKRLKLGVLLRGVGINQDGWDPALSIIVQAQTELRAFAELASQLGPAHCGVEDLSELGFALEDICRRLDIAHELLGRPQNANDPGGAEEAPAEEEPPSSEEPHLGDRTED